MEKMKACGFPVFWGSGALFFEGWAGWLCVVCLGVQMAEMNCWIGLPGREAGQAGERTDVCLRSGTGGWAGGYLDFWEKFGFWERM